MTPHDELSDDSTHESMSPVSPDASVPSSSTCPQHGEYYRTGRGGAGNMWQQSAPLRRPDSEAGGSTSLRARRKLAIDIEHIDTSAAIRAAQSRNTSQYVRVGRSLQYVQSNEPQQSPVASSFRSPKSPTSASSPILNTGRGGSGNWGASAAAVEQARLVKEKQEEAEAEKRRQEAEQHVTAMLQPPSQAYTGSRRRSTLPGDFELS